jgi:DNA polymerase (family 10)
MRNAEIAEAFEELASLYELDGAVIHRVTAYRNAAKAVREAGASVAELARSGRAQELPGVGKTIAEKIDVLLATGSIPAAERLRAVYPAGLVEITRMPGLGPQRVRALHEHLGVKSVDDLRRAVDEGRLVEVPGFGPKAAELVTTAIAAHQAGTPGVRFALAEALTAGEAIVEALRPHAARVELAGSARRMADSCKDLDVVAAGTDGEALLAAFAALPEVEAVRSSGAAGARAVTHSGLPIDLRVVPEEAFGSLLQHLTGSGAHNEALRTEAVRRGLHVSEYGIADDGTGRSHPCATEAEVYERLGMQPIPPELRENRGELAAARRGALPELVRLEDVRGDLHMHTVASDGRNTIAEMAEAARERGYEYAAITDHSASHGFGDDVSPDELLRQIERVRSLEVPGLTLLAGSEVNVLPDGSLDYADELLEQLDWVVASVHTSFRMGEREMTERVVRALEHPLVDALGHPTGRLIGRREPYAIDMDRVIETAARSGTFLEINADPDRRDLPDTLARAAVEAGVTIVLGSDAHRVSTLANMRYGVATARRAWLSAERVANTRSWEELQALRKPRRG